MKRFRIPIVLFVLLFTFLIFKNPSEIIASFTQYKLGLNYGLVGYWTFDGKDTNWATGRTNDVSGNGYYGTLQSMSTSTTPTIGKVGQGLLFNGSTNFLSVGTTLDIPALPLSVCSWVNHTDNADYGTIIAKRDGYDSTTMRFNFNTMITTGEIIIDGGGAVYATISDYQVPLGQWVHLCVVATSSLPTLYVNGAYQEVMHGAGGDFVLGSSATANVLIGATLDGGATVVDYFKGKLDDVRLYNRGLSVAEVTQLYNLGGSKLGVLPKPAASSPLGSGLVAYFTLDGKDTHWATGRTDDVSGSGLIGTLQAMSTSTTPVMGKLGQGFYFNGVMNNYVDAGNNAAIQLTTVGTISVWVKFTNEASFPFLVGNADWSNDRNGYALGTSVGTIGNFHFSLNDAGSTIALQTTLGGYNDGSWHLVTGTWNGSFMNLYVDGLVAATPLAQSINAVSGAQNLTIGKDPASGNYYLTGSVDDFRLYNRALSANEIAQLYNLGAVKFGVSPTNTKMPINQGLVGYWTFDGKDTNWATGRTDDVSGGGAILTAQGMATTTTPVQGKLGQGMYFDGNNNFDGGDVSSLNMGTNDWTVSVWIKTTSTAGPPIFIAKTDYICGGDHGWGLGLLASGRLQLALGDSTNCVFAPADDGVIVADGTWHHAVVVFNRATNAVRYVDGMVSGSAYDISIFNGSNISTALPFCIGARCPAGASDFFNGSLDDVRVYNRALTATEVAQLYQMGQSTIR